MRITSIIFLVVFCSVLVSANGVQVTPNSLILNKTSGSPLNFSLTFSNEEPLDFHNFTSNNPNLVFEKFSLLSGQNKTVIVSYDSNSPFSGDVRFLGEYFADLGHSNTSYEVLIDNTGLDLCNLELVEGDSITWNNTLAGEVKLKNLNSDEYFATLQSGQSFTQEYLTPLSFSYQVYRIGIPFSQVCTLEVNPSEGYIHSRDYDGLLNLEVLINYPPTTLNVITYSSSYNLSFNSAYDDVITIRNSGSNPAKGVTLSGDWFDFGVNNFDLGVGESRNVNFKVKPIIFQTNQTNKSYDKSIVVSGNFPTITKNFSVFIKYQSLSSNIGNNSYDRETLKNLVYFYCSIYPDDCPRIVIDSNSSNRNVSFNINEETYREQILAQANFYEEVLNDAKIKNERIAFLEAKLTNSSLEIANATSKVDNLEKSNSEFNGLVTFILIGIGFLLVSGLLAYLYYSDKAKIKISNLFKNKGEKYI